MPGREACEDVDERGRRVQGKDLGGGAWKGRRLKDVEYLCGTAAKWGGTKNEACMAVAAAASLALKMDDYLPWPLSSCDNF